MNPQQVWFDLGKVILGAILGFFFGTGGRFLEYYALNRDRRLRLLEREGRKHKFWKDFFDTQNALPEAARYSVEDMNEAVESCKTDLSRSYQEVMGHTLLANSLAKAFGAFLALLVFLLLWLPGEGDMLARIIMLGFHYPPYFTNGMRFTTSVLQALVIWHISYSLLYRAPRDWAKRKILDRQRKRLLRFSPMTSLRIRCGSI